MKKISISSLLFILLSYFPASAQLFFCANYTDEGAPIGISTDWSLGENGGYVYMLYSNKDKAIRYNSLSVVVMKLTGKTYVLFDRQTMDVQDKKNWAVFDYHFIEPGNYEVSIKENNRTLAKNICSVTLKNRNDENGGGPDQNYYNTTVTFCHSIKDNKPFETANSFEPGSVNIFMENDKPLSTDSMIVMLYKREPGSQSYNQYYDLKKYGISRTAYATYFDWNFTEGGDYAVELYNNNFARMGIGYVTIFNNPESEKQQDPDATYYHASTTFCDTVVDGDPKNEGTVFHAGRVFVYIYNDKPLKTDSIIVDIQKKGFGVPQYNVYVNTLNFGINGKLRGTYFPIDMEDIGQYKIDIFNRKMQKISEGYVTIR